MVNGKNEWCVIEGNISNVCNTIHISASFANTHTRNKKIETKSSERNNEFGLVGENLFYQVRMAGFDFRRSRISVIRWSTLYYIGNVVITRSLVSES